MWLTFSRTLFIACLWLSLFGLLSSPSNAQSVLPLPPVEEFWGGIEEDFNQHAAELFSALGAAAGFSVVLRFLLK